MGQYRIKSEPLGVDFMVQGDQAPNAKSTFQILKQVVSPDKMIKAYEGGHKQLAREAFKNGYFDQEQDSDLYDVFKQAAGEVLEGLEGISKEVSLDFAASGMMTYGVPGSQQMVEAARQEQQKRRKQRKATGYQLAAEVFAGYKTIGDAGKLGFSKLVGEGDEDIDASIEFIKGMMETEAFLNDGASIMAEQFSDFDMYNDLKAGRVSPDKQQALAGSLFVQLENPLAMVSAGAVRSTTNMLRRGTAKKLAEQLQNAEAKKLLYSQQLNRLSANAPDNVVQSATDALKGATKEADEILEKLKPYTEQKAKAGAGFTNKAIGKTMQGLGKAGEYVGNMTEFLRRAGIEEATTFLMRTGLSESAAKTVVFGTVGAGLDATDGEMSLGGSGLNALAAYMGPRALATMGRSTAILGKQLTIAESSLPFFKRVGALPADNPKLSEVLVDRTENLVLGDATSQLKPILTQSRELPSLVRGTARVLDRSGVGRVLTEGANLTKATVAGASIPGAFGYMAGGEEGAASAIGASAPFIAAGLGYGSLLRFSSNSDLIAKQLGDLEYHKQSLTEPELREFKKLKKDQQIAISTFSQFFPDVVIRVKSMGRDGPNGAQYVDGKDSVVEINSDSDNPLGVVLAHEIGHHIERHGLLPNILEELIGNAEKGRVGLFTKIDEKTGKPIVQTDANGLKFYELNQEFRDLQQAYIEKLKRTNVSDKDRLRYETPEHFAREIFAEIVAERMISGKTAKRARQSTTYKMIESLGERITSGGFKRKVMHSLGMATNKDGSIVRGTGVLNKAFRSSRELDNLVKRYEDETIGLSESEIREQRPVVGDDELDTVIVSPNDPIESLQAFNNGGHFKTNEDGSIKINPITRKPEVFTPAETRQANQALARDLIDAIQARENDLPEGHVTLSETADGKLVGSGKFIDDSIIDELAKTGRYNASQISYLREASRAGREGQGNHMLLFYYAATGKGGRKYKTLKGGYRDSLVYGVTITKDGNVIFDTVSLDKLQKNVDYLLKRRGKEIAQAFGGSDDATVRQNFESMFEKYLDNHAKGIINGDSNPESGITDKQRDFLNAAFGPVSKSQIADNPTLSNLGERRANTLATYRSRRLDRIGTIQPTGNTRNVVIDRLRRNLMPGRGDSDKLFHPAYHGTPHTFAPEPGAPLGKFRTSAIGTGEGAQAYGHGLYFAGRKGVAEHYRQKLTQVENPAKLLYDGQPYDPYNNKHYANLRLRQARGNRTRAIKSLEDAIHLEKHNQRVDPQNSSPIRLKQFEETLEVIKNKQEAKSDEGSLYKVELAPKENEYLLWDKPLSEQPKGVRDIFIKKYGKEEFDLVKDDLALEWYQSETDYFGSQEQASAALKEAGIPGIKYLDGSSRSKGEGDYNYVIFDEADVQITDKLFMPASEAGAGKGKVPKSGDMLSLDDKSLKLFLPSPGNPNASLSEFKGKNVQVLTTDLSMVGDKKIDGATVAFTGGPGYLSVNDAWGFTNEGSAKAFKTRWKRDDKPLIGLTSMKQDNHKASTLTREYYVRKFMQAINQGKIAESLVNEHIIEALTRAAKGKGLTDSQKRALLSVKNIEDFLRIFSNGQIIPWKATPKIYDRLSQATLPIKQGKLKELGLDLDTILRETRQKEYNDIKKGSLLAIAEYDGSDAVYRPDLNSAYPWSIPLKEKAFLKDFADIQDLSSRQDLRGSDGDANMAVAMGAGVMLDKLGRGDVNFMPSGRPTRQPANRITRQAPAMPGNRFMLPAVSAGAKSAERFR